MELKSPIPKRCKLATRSNFGNESNLLSEYGHVFSGYFNGTSVVVEDPDEMKALYTMGFFGKGSLSRGFPCFGERKGVPPVLKDYQWKRREEWACQLGLILGNMPNVPSTLELPRSDERMDCENDSMPNQKPFQLIQETQRSVDQNQQSCITPDKPNRSCKAAELSLENAMDVELVQQPPTTAELSADAVILKADGQNQLDKAAKPMEVDGLAEASTDPVVQKATEPNPLCKAAEKSTENPMDIDEQSQQPPKTTELSADTLVQSSDNQNEESDKATSEMTSKDVQIQQLPKTVESSVDSSVQSSDEQNKILDKPAESSEVTSKDDQIQQPSNAGSLVQSSDEKNQSDKTESSEITSINDDQIQKPSTTVESKVDSLVQSSGEQSQKLVITAQSSGGTSNDDNQIQEPSTTVDSNVDSLVQSSDEQSQKCNVTELNKDTSTIDSQVQEPSTTVESNVDSLVQSSGEQNQESVNTTKPNEGSLMNDNQIQEPSTTVDSEVLNRKSDNTAEISNVEQSHELSTTVQSTAETLVQSSDKQNQVPSDTAESSSGSLVPNEAESRPTEPAQITDNQTLSDVNAGMQLPIHIKTDVDTLTPGQIYIDTSQATVTAHGDSTSENNIQENVAPNADLLCSIKSENIEEFHMDTEAPVDQIDVGVEEFTTPDIGLVKSEIEDGLMRQDNQIKVSEVLVISDCKGDVDDYIKNLKPRLEGERFKFAIELLNLTLEEAFFLHFAVGCLNICDLGGRNLSLREVWVLFTRSQKDFIESYVAYHYFRAKGWVVKCGLKFGGQFLLYKNGPPFHHASYVVIIKNIKEKDNNENDASSFTWKEMMSVNRVAESSKKEVLVCQILWPDNLHDTSSPSILNSFKVSESLLRRWQPCQ